MLNTCSIGRRWKSREGWSRPVLTGERGTLFPIPLGDWVSSCGGFLVGWQGTLFLVVTTTILVRRLSFASVVRFPDRHDRNRGWFRCRPPSWLGLAVHSGFAVVMAQVRRPVPFRTRKLRPGTAMVLHPTGCGRVARRRITRTGSPSEHTPQGAFAYPKHSRPKPTHPHKNTRGFSHARTQTGHLRHPHGNGASPYPWDHD